MVATQSRPATATEQAWVDIGVDDLTKYRIVQHLYLRRSQAGESVGVDTLAASLGFHSLEQTADAVAGLALSGVIRLDSPPGGPARCTLTTDPSIVAGIGSLLQRAQTPGEAADLLERLALRSLARARARVEGRLRTRGPAGSVRCAP